MGGKVAEWEAAVPPGSSPDIWLCLRTRCHCCSTPEFRIMGRQSSPTAQLLSQPDGCFSSSSILRRGAHNPLQLSEVGRVGLGGEGRYKLLAYSKLTVLLLPLSFFLNFLNFCRR